MGTPLSKLVENKPLWFKTDIEKLAKNDAKVKEALKKDGMRELFLNDPSKFLKELNIPLSVKSKSLMRKNIRALQELQKAHYFELEDGQIVKANIRVNIK